MVFCSIGGDYLQKTDEELISELNKLALELGHIPTFRECNSCSYTSMAKTYCKRFGSWQKAMKAAGLLKGKYLKANLKRLKRELGHTPSMKECNDCEFTVHSCIYIKKYGSWSAALMEAGLKPRTDREEMLINLRQLAIKLGHFPTEEEVNKCKNTPSFRSYRREFGSWEDLKKLIKI